MAFKTQTAFVEPSTREESTAIQEENSSTVVVGETGSGKSTMLGQMLLSFLMWRRIVLFDPQQNATARDIARLLMSRREPLIWERLSDNEFGLAHTLLSRSTSTGYLKAEEDQRGMHELAAALAQNRGFDQVEEHPLILFTVFMAFRVYLGLPERVPLRELRWLFRSPSTQSKRLLKRCGDQEAVQFWRTLPPHPASRERQLGPAERFLAPLLDSPAVDLRDFAGPDLTSIVDAGYHYILEGSDHMSPQSNRMILQMRLYAILQGIRAGLRNLLIVLEEAEYANLVTSAVGRSLLQDRKHGITWIIISQNGNFGDATTSVFQNTTRIWMRCSGEVALLAARDLLLTAFDPFAVKDVKYRVQQEQVGWETITQESHTTRESGKPSQTASTREVPVYRPHLDKTTTYFSRQEQEGLFAKWITQLKTGAAFANSGGNVSYLEVPYSPNPMTDAELEAKYDELRRSWPYARLGAAETEPSTTDSETKGSKVFSIPIRGRYGRRSQPGSSPLDQLPPDALNDSEDANEPGSPDSSEQWP